MRHIPLFTLVLLSIAVFPNRSSADTFIFHDTGDAITGEYQGNYYGSPIRLGIGYSFTGGPPVDPGHFEVLGLEFDEIACLHPLTCLGPPWDNFSHWDNLAPWSPWEAAVAIYDSSGTLSDFMYGSCVADGICQVAFFSDVDGFPLDQATSGFSGFVHDPRTSRIIEDGTVQDAFHIHWDVGRDDVIRFQSEVPEPSSLMLLFSLVGIMVWRSRRATGCIGGRSMKKPRR